MKFTLGTVILVFVWCIFMGITVGSIGIGAIFPSVNLIAKPFVCPNGKMRLETQDYTPSPVETVTTLTWYCDDASTGESTVLGLFPMSLYAGTMYGLLLFVVALIFLWNSSRGGEVPITVKSLPIEAHKGRRGLPEELQYLQGLLDSGQITQDEYVRRTREAARNLHDE